jgi:phage gp36-like protein
MTSAELRSRRGAEIDRLAEGDEARIEQAIQDAESEAVSYLSVRYATLPTTPATTPDVVKCHVAVLAHRRLAPGHSVALALDEEVRGAREWLSRVSRGVANLDLATKPAEDRTAGPLAIASSSSLGPLAELAERAFR